MHRASGRTLDVFTDMPCVLINTAQDFPDYGKMFFKEEILNITEMTTPNAKFAMKENEQQTSSISIKDKLQVCTISNLELILPEDEEDGEQDLDLTESDSNITKMKPVVGKSKTVYSKHSGICIRPQLFPDAIMHVSFYFEHCTLQILILKFFFIAQKNFNSIILKPSKLYRQKTIYKFGVIPLETK